MLILWTLATLFVAFISRDVIKKYFIPSKKPPLASGALPVVGHLYTVDFGNLHEELQRIAKDIGGVFRLAIGPTDWVVLATYDLVRKVFGDSGNAFTARPRQFINHEITGGDNLGVLYANGKAWNEQRSFILQSLHNLGTASMEAKVLRQLGKLVRVIERQVDEAEDGRTSAFPSAYFKDVVHGVFADTLLGVDYDFDGKEFAKLQEDVRRVAAVLANGNACAMNLWPWVCCLPFDLSGYKTFRKSNHDLETVLEKKMDEKCSSIGTFASEEPDLAELYLRELQRKTAQHGSGHFSKKQLLRSIVDMWAVGSEKVIEMLNYLILFMIRYPDIQEKVHLEIQEKIGYTRPVGLQDRGRLKYLQACIVEAHRIGNVADVTYLHTSQDNTRIGDFDVPKGTPVVASLYAIHMDPEKYLQPDKYIPERFVDRDMKHVKVDEHIIPYGLGKRSCIGEDFAKIQIFLIFATLMQKFKFLALPGREFPDLKYVRETTMHCVPFRCAVERRSTEIAEKIDLE